MPVRPPPPPPGVCNVFFPIAHLPPDSLQLGQVQATLRSLFPSPLGVSMSSSPIWTRRLFRSLGFSVESPLSCHSSESGSSFIWMPEPGDEEGSLFINTRNLRAAHKNEELCRCPIPAGLFASSPCVYWTPACVTEFTVTVWRLGRLTWPVWPRGRVWTGAKVSCWACPCPCGSWRPWSDWTPWTCRNRQDRC